MDFDYAQESELIKAIGDGLVPEVIRGVSVVEVNKNPRPVVAAANSSRLASSDVSPSEMTNKKPKINKRPTASSRILAYFKETDSKRAEERKLQAQAAEKRDDERKRKADLQAERMDSRESLKREQYEEMVQLKRRKYDLLDRFTSTLERKK